MIEEKVPTSVGAFFVIQIASTRPDFNQKEAKCSEIAACFKMKTEHENLHRNTSNINLLESAADQQHKRVVVKCSVWW